ncbi:MAG: hypothetical protein AAF871_00965 [Pseudomonadota bacterium]
MILIEAGARHPRSFEGKVHFAQLLAERGHRVAIDAETLPEGLSRALRYDLATLLANVEETDLDAVVVLGAEAIEDATLSRLRRVLLRSPSAPIHVIGRFDTVQARSHARTRLAYAIGREPTLVDLLSTQSGTSPSAVASPFVIPVAEAPPKDLGALPALYVIITEDLMEEPQTIATLGAVAFMKGFRLSAVVSGKSKERIRQSRYAGLSVFHFSEIPPWILAKSADMAAFFGEDVPGERMAELAGLLMGQGKPVIDATLGAVFQSAGAPALRGPIDVGALPYFLEATVLPNAHAIGADALKSAWVRTRDIAQVEARLDLKPPPRKRPTDSDVGQAVFFPTNGHGLGHARRCALVAAEMPKQDRIAFAAFPSCVGMIQSHGYPALPLVSRSPMHEDNFDNDILTERRLARLVGPEDHLIFDGGYIFDSVVRTIKRTGCRSTWIRRELFRPGQINAIEAEREGEFDRVIVPRECFEELNTEGGFKPRVHPVGPIVDILDPAGREGERARLKKAFERDFDRLVVTMLGSGTSSDRTAQLNALCLQLEARPGLLHLIVGWPGSQLAPGLFQWKTTRVVRTLSSANLAQAADFVVSAAGYNSFHELVYNRVPTIFLPQIASFLDDQERRAAAAADRGIGAAVGPEDFLSLERLVNEWLETDQPDAMRAELGRLELPSPGAADAARLIGEAMG